MKRVIILSLVLLLALGSMAGCQKAPEEPPAQPTEQVKEVSLINPVGPVVIPMAGIQSGNVKGDTAVNLSYWKNNDEAVGLLTSGKADFAVLPVSMAANLYASGIDLVLLGVHEWKVFYLVAAKDANFTGWQSLQGKTVYSPVSKGQTVDVLTRYALAREGLNPDEEVAFAYAPPQEIVALFKSGQIEYAALPEPYATLAIKDTEGKIVLDYQEYWGEATGKNPRIPIAGLFVTRSFLDKYPNATDAVAELVARSTDWSNQNVDAALSSTAEVLPIPAPVMKSALERIDFTYVPVAECQDEVQTYLETIQKVYPDAVKKIPDKGFYTE